MIAVVEDTNSKCSLFLNWVKSNGFKVVVFDMDCTMSRSHCGPGLLRDKLDEYIGNASPDFIHALQILSKQSEIRCAVATGSDPAEYNLPGQSPDTHILGPDLATAVISAHCPDALHLFEIMVGYDYRLHDVESDETCAYENREGKRHHMRLIKDHYGVDHREMVLFDDATSSLINEDGWVGVKVNKKHGFRFSDLTRPIQQYFAN
jgi:hypothetical protein